MFTQASLCDDLCAAVAEGHSSDLTCVVGWVLRTSLLSKVSERLNVNTGGALAAGGAVRGGMARLPHSVSVKSPSRLPMMSCAPLSLKTTRVISRGWFSGWIYLCR